MSDQMPLQQQQKEPQEIKVTREERMKEAWDVTKDFHEKAEIATADGVEYAGYNNLDMEQLVREMKYDADGKSESFNDMYNAMSDFIKLAKNGGKTFDEQTAKDITADYFLKLYDAKSMVNRYVHTHGGHRWTETGKRRIQISLRLQSLLKSLELKIEDSQKNLPKTMAKRVQYAKEGFKTPEQIKAREEMEKANELAKEVEDNLRLQAMVENMASKDEVLAQMQNDQNMTKANLIFITKAVEKQLDVTGGLLELKKMFSEYIAQHVLPQWLIKEPKDFEVHYHDMAQYFAEENKDLITRVKKRQAEFCYENHISGATAGLWDYPEVNDLLMRGSDEDFKNGLEALKERTAQNDAVIDDMLKESVSVLTRDALRASLNKKLGGARIFGSTDQLIDLTGAHIDMIHFVEPTLGEQEEKVRCAMASLWLPTALRDHFIETVSKGDMAAFAKLSISEMVKRGNQYKKRYKNNSKKIEKVYNRKNQLLTYDQWQKLNDLMLTCGAEPQHEIDQKIEDILVQNQRGAVQDEISLREYRSQRHFNDAKVTAAREKTIEEEKNKLGALNTEALSQRLLVTIGSFTQTDHRNPFRRVKMALSGDVKSVNNFYANRNERKKERIDAFKEELKNMGLSDAQQEAMLERMTPLMKGMLSVDTDLPEDVRLSNERFNMEHFGAFSWDNAVEELKKYSDVIKTGSENKAIEGARARFDERRDYMMQYQDGRYKLIVDFLTDLPEVYTAMMSDDNEAMAKCFRDFVKPRFANLCDGMVKAGKIGEAFKLQYVYSHQEELTNGTLRGDVDFFAKEVGDYAERILMSPLSTFTGYSDTDKAIDFLDGKYDADQDKTIISLINDVQNKVAKKYAKGKNESALIRTRLTQKIQEMFNDPEQYLNLFNRKKLTAALSSAATSAGGVEELDKNRIKRAKKDEKGNITGWEWEDVTALREEDVDAADLKDKSARDAILRKKLDGAAARMTYFGINGEGIRGIRLGKSLIRIADRNDATVSLDKKRVDHVRGALEKYAGYVELPNILKDAIIELGASGNFIDEAVKGYRFDPNGSRLVRHANAMKKMLDYLTHEPVGEENATVMSQDEAQLFILHHFTNSGTRAMYFDNKKGPDLAHLRRTRSFQSFHENYLKLKQMEEEPIDDPSLESERLEMSRNLRAILVTDRGVLDKNGKEFNTDKITKDEEYKEFKEKLSGIFDKQIAYFKRSKELVKAIVDEINTNPELSEYSDDFKEQLVTGLRHYHMGDILDELKDDTKKKDWAKQLKLEFRGGETDEEKAQKIDKFVDRVVNKTSSIGSSNYGQRHQQKTDNAYDEKRFSDLIDKHTTLFKGRFNRYNELDNDQKKLFALALILMDKGAVGVGTGGTAEALASPNLKQKQVTGAAAAMQAYIAGEPFDYPIDYQEATYKLFNYGRRANIFQTTVLSKTAYDKAYLFAQTMLARRQFFGEKDTVRLNDATSSIRTAATKYSKPQQNEVDKLSTQKLTFASVKAKLAEYAKLDGQDGWAEKISNMKDSDVQLFVRLMQDRTVLDKSTIGKYSQIHADAQKRKALLDSLSSLDEKKRYEIMRGFDDDDSCHKAMFSALSFQLKDHINFKGKDLTKDMFADGALDRKSLIDWNLVRHAFEFMQEIKTKQKATHAMAHANDEEYIRASKNKKAIKQMELLKLKHNDLFSEMNEFTFYSFIKDQADKDDTDECKAMLAGFEMLSERQKRLFVKVLGRRDLLDISKQNYIMNFIGTAERDYVNKADRFALIDDYVNSSMQNGIGILLEKGSHMKAAMSLLSTQVSDRSDFNTTGGLMGTFSWERNFIMGRDTAVDWKLFARALNFVNRATDELEYREGNSELYRSAGEISKHGQFDMNYSFLRKNFHSTGNHFARRAARSGVNYAKEELKFDKTLNTVISIIDSPIVSKIANKTGVGKYHNSVSRFAGKIKTESGKIKSPAQYNIDLPLKLQEEETKDEAKDKLYYEKVEDNINTIINNGKSMKDTAVELGQYIRKNFIDGNQLTKFGWIVEDKEATVDKKNLVEKINNVNTEKEDIAKYGDISINEAKGKIKAATNKTGDIRDVKTKATSAKNTIKDVGTLSFQVASLGGIKLTLNGAEIKDLDGLVDHCIQLTTMRFLNDKVWHKNIDLTPTVDKDGKVVAKDEVKELEKAMKSYANDILVNAIGDEQKAADILKNLEEKATFTNAVMKGTKTVMGYVKYAQSCVGHIQNIFQNVENLRLLSQGEDTAEQFRNNDERKLLDARKRQNDSQRYKVENIHKKHKDMTHLGKELGKNVQEFAIAENALNIATDTVKTFAGPLNVTSKLVVDAAKMGVEFAMYAARCMKDDSTLLHYYTESERGQVLISKISRGFEATGHKDMKEKLKGKKTLKTIGDALGYESKDELRRNAGMQMAQSIIFCASKYNPMKETRLMAIAVMSVMGMTNKIGDIKPETAEMLFNQFKMG